MRTRTRYHLLPIFLILFLLLGSIPASNAEVTTGAQAKRVMFRSDDVTPMSLSALKAVNQVHIDEGVPVTLGVIPARSFPLQSQCNPSVANNSSSEMIEYLRPLTSSGLFELAQHGYGHCNNSRLYGVPLASEFQGMPRYEQYRLINEGRSSMEQAFGVAPTTFIPPFNTGDENTLKTVSALGFTVYSSFAGEFEPTSGGGLTLKPEILAINENDTLGSLVNQTNTLLNDSRVNDIVIVYHNDRFEANPPADGVNATKVELLRHYIQYLKTNNVEFTTLNGRHSSPQVSASPLSTTSTSTFMALPQKVGAQWPWTILAFAAPLLLAALLFGISKKVK